MPALRKIRILERFSRGIREDLLNTYLFKTLADVNQKAPQDPIVLGS
jgi:hypothetical protein